jgi:L-cysteine desulfidase
MGNYRTAQGKSIDMAALAAKNERVRAVGNMKVNARGDTIDATGKVVVPVTQKVGQQYQKTVGNRSAQPKKDSEIIKVAPKVKEQLTKEEMDLEASFNDDLEIEEIKAKQQK